MTLDSPEIVSRHADVKKAHNLSWDYPSYVPHVTLLYDTKLQPLVLQGLKKVLVGRTLVLGKESVEDLNTDHSDV